MTFAYGAARAVITLGCALFLQPPSSLAAPPSGENIRPYAYTGRESDAGGLFYYRSRYYDATLGRYAQRDTIGLAGGLNDYLYVAANPVARVDPTGNYSDDDGRFLQDGAREVTGLPDDFMDHPTALRLLATRERLQLLRQSPWLPALIVGGSMTAASASVTAAGMVALGTTALIAPVDYFLPVAVAATERWRDLLGGSDRLVWPSYAYVPRIQRALRYLNMRLEVYQEQLEYTRRAGGSELQALRSAQNHLMPDLPLAQWKTEYLEIMRFLVNSAQQDLAGMRLLDQELRRAMAWQLGGGLGSVATGLARWRLGSAKGDASSP